MEKIDLTKAAEKSLLVLWLIMMVVLWVLANGFIATNYNQSDPHDQADFIEYHEQTPRYIR